LHVITAVINSCNYSLKPVCVCVCVCVCVWWLQSVLMSAIIRSCSEGWTLPLRAGCGRVELSK